MESSNEKKSIKISLKQLIIGLFIIALVILTILLFVYFKAQNSMSKLKKIDKGTTISKNETKQTSETVENETDQTSEIVENTIDQTSETVENTLKQANENIEVVPTLLDEISDNSSWCGTFQLVWNDMKNEVIKRDIIFNKQLNIVENLNKETFTTKDISDEYYYKDFGEKSPELKEKFEKGIKEKFNQDSDILDQIDWTPSAFEECYVFYTMLYKEFNFKNDFDTLENGEFHSNTKTYGDIKYFGIDDESSSELYDQVEVLYYNRISDFAIILNTKENDEIILTVGDNGTTFADIYNNVVEKSNNFEGNKEFGENDSLKVPNLNFNILKRYSELTTDGSDYNKYFLDYKNKEHYISDAIQTIQMELDKSGGKVKSEAIMATITLSTIDTSREEKRYFNCNKEFTIFIKEKKKDIPYFAANIADIELFQ